MKGSSPQNQGQVVGRDPLVGHLLAERFLLKRLVARGGMGRIYEAVQEPLGRTVALKILDAAASGEEFQQRFFMEAATCAKLTHPNTIRIFDYGRTEDGIFFIVMEYLKGRTLHDLIASDAPVPPMTVVSIMRQVCGALIEAHDEGIVHRDLKPANIFLADRGDRGEVVKVIDFGLVKDLGTEASLSQTGNLLGSPLYMAPEQVHGKAIDRRTDVYALGLIMYAMLTGKTAFKKGNPIAVMVAQAEKKPPTFAEANPSVEVPAALEWVVQTCIEKSKEDRFEGMQALLNALNACEQEILGALDEPLVLGLNEGRVVLPPGVDIASVNAFSAQVEPTLNQKLDRSAAVAAGLDRRRRGGRDARRWVWIGRFCPLGNRRGRARAARRGLGDVGAARLRDGDAHL